MLPHRNPCLTSHRSHPSPSTLSMAPMTTWCCHWMSSTTRTSTAPLPHHRRWSAPSLTRRRWSGNDHLDVGRVVKCMATDSRSIIVYPTSKESTFQFLVPSRWSRPSSGEKIWVNIPAPRQMSNEKCRRLTLTKTRRKTSPYSGNFIP